MGSKPHQSALFTGLVAYLKKYIEGHYHPQLRIDKTFIDQRGAFAFCLLDVGGKTYTIRLRLPHNAPIGARPLFDSMYLGEQLLWRYSVDYRPNVPWGEQRRVHLYHFSGVHFLIHVLAGTPYDVIEKVTYLNGDDPSPELAAMLRIHVAKLWGMTTTISKAERRVLSALQKKGVLS